MENVAALAIRAWLGGQHYYGTLWVGPKSETVRAPCDAARARLLTRDSNDRHSGHGTVYRVGEESSRFYDEASVIEAAKRQLPAHVILLVLGDAFSNVRKCPVLWAIPARSDTKA